LSLGNFNFELHACGENFAQTKTKQQYKTFQFFVLVVFHFYWMFHSNEQLILWVVVLVWVSSKGGSEGWMFGKEEILFELMKKENKYLRNNIYLSKKLSASIISIRPSL